MPMFATLFITDLIFAGVHGSTGREMTDPQHIKVDIHLVVDIARSRETDVLADTYDYKRASAIAKCIIENDRFVLIERLATRIGEAICEDPKVVSSKITVSKLQGSSNGVPGITVTCWRVPQDLGSVNG